MAVYEYKNINSFRKGQKTSKYYQDPTYLTFMLQFMFDDAENSPLLADAGSDNPRIGTAAYYLKEYIKDDDRAFYLAEFVKTLRLINKEMPWFWQSLAGVETFINYNVMEPYRGGDDAKITITCLESLNLMVAGMMDLYRAAMWDEDRWVWVVPDNLRKFSLIVYVSEMRKIQLGPNTGNQTSAIQTPFDANSVTGENLPFFAFKASKCEFELNSGNLFADLSAIEPKQATSTIDIKYERIHTYDARYLNGIMGVRLDLSDRASNGSLSDNGINPTAPFASGYTGPFADQVRQVTDLSEEISNVVTQFPKKLAKNAQREMENMVSGMLGNVFLGNVHDARFTFRDALRQGSINAIAKDLGNVF